MDTIYPFNILHNLVFKNGINGVFSWDTFVIQPLSFQIGLWTNDPCFLYLLRLIYAHFQLEAPEWKTISSNAKDLVLKMLAPNFHNRLTIEEVLNHPWMRVSFTYIHIIEFEFEWNMFAIQTVFTRYNHIAFLNATIQNATHMIQSHRTIVVSKQLWFYQIEIQWHCCGLISFISWF